ncbi:MAG TPA: BTAD domain-containing putative transcriptional regulator [Micromonosporaceae bacterium]|nr:BTAD domain-containing putative transcriptional regulator [Micromonosporaceae bacterium]
MRRENAAVPSRGTAVRLELVDGFRLLADGRAVETVGTAERLLAYLALTGPAARAVAAGTLWPDVAEHRALASLRTAIWQCNRAVDGLVTTRGQHIALAGFARVDVRELDGTPPSYDPASAILRTRQGELLPGWYDDWVIGERERLRHRRLQLLEDGARRLTATGKLADAYELAFEAVRCEPLRESARRAVIGVHLAQHNVSEAIREYRRFRRLLIDHLGVEPSADLADLVFAGRAARPANRQPDAVSLAARSSAAPAVPAASAASAAPVSSGKPTPRPPRTRRRPRALPR